MTVHPRQMFLGASAALVLGALVVLAAWAQGDAEIEIDPRALAQARTQHQRMQTMAEAQARRSQRRSQARSRPRRPVRLPASDPATRAPTPDEDESPPERPQIEIRKKPRVEDPEDHKKILDARMDGANYLYDRKRYEEAMAEAIEILGEADKPAHRVRMLRIIVSSACIMGQSDKAQEYAATLPDRDFHQMKVRCQRYGTDLER